MDIKERMATPVEDTINSCDDIFQFQIIAKAGAKYREAYHVVDGEKQSVQKVNRVYATADERYGKIFKVKAEDDSEAKIDSLPEHCIIDNDNELSINEVDRSFYIAMAKKRVDDFKGIKPEKTKKPRRTKKMATTTKTANVYQKLLTARAKFLEANVEKTGKNMHLSFKYFELEDIVPTAIRIFNEVGLIPVVNFTADVATMNIINTDTDTGKVDVPSNGKTLYRVQTGAFSKRSNADAWAAKLKAAGFDTYIVQMGNLYKVQVGAYSQKSNAENMMAKLKAAGYDAFITTKSGTAAGIAKKSAAEIAKEIYNGTCSDARWSSWGNGTDRVNRLKQAGYDPSEVQSEVNKLF